MGKPDLLVQLRHHNSIIKDFTDNPSLWDCEDTSSLQVKRVETHGATVLLGSEYAIKIKKPVLFDHMDYSTAEKRFSFCQHEFALNNRTAAILYVGVFAIYKAEGGQFCLQETGKAVDYLIKMRRFADGDRLDEVSTRGAFSPLLTEQLCSAIVTFHSSSEIVGDLSKIPDFHEIINQNFKQLDIFCPSLFQLEGTRNYRKKLHDFANMLSPLQERRRQKNWIRAGHGDLHLQNICLFDGKPLLFDAIEYEDNFVIGDVLYDICFLLMDLWQRGQKQAANRIFNQYFQDMGWLRSSTDLDVLKTLPFFLSMRSGIRTHVAANRFHQSENTNSKDLYREEAKQLFNASVSYLTPAKPRMIAIGGFSGSGKSTLAANLAPHIGPTPGALRIRSDVIRRLLIGWDKYSPMPRSAYTSAQSQAVYDHMQQLAQSALIAGHSVIIDAVLDRTQDRRDFEKIATDLSIPFKGIWLSVARDVMAERISRRTRDASDATVHILDAQIARHPETVLDWENLDANGTETNMTARARCLLQ